MAKIILKCLYLQPGMKNHSKNLVKYIAQRDNVDKIDDSWKYLPVSIAQKELIGQLLEDFPDAKSSFEYRDYIHAQNKGNASQLITRTLEDNYDRIGTRDNYMRYIAYRPGAERFGLHGLFTDANVPIDLDEVATEVSTHKGRVWTDIVSIRREDAARLGYETGEAWRSLIRGQAQKIAECMKIPREDLRWYAAFHNEAHHPHVHIVAYSVGKEPYLSKQGIKDLKSSLAREIFKQDLMQTYETQTQYRNRLSAETKDRVQKIVDDINRGTYENPTISLMMRKLAEILQHTKGKKVYSILRKKAREVDTVSIDNLPVAIDDDPLEFMMKQSDYSTLLSVISRLPISHREIIFLRYIQGMDVKEVADLIGRTPNYVRVQVHRSKKLLADLCREVSHCEDWCKKCPVDTF